MTKTLERQREKEKSYIVINGGEVERMLDSSKEVIEYANNLKKEFFSDDEFEPEYSEEWKDFVIDSIPTANQFIREFDIQLVEDRNTECSLLVKRMIDKNEKVYFKIRTREYYYHDQGFWKIKITPLLEFPDTREVKFQIYATKHCPSGLWDNGIEKSKHYTYCPKAFKDLDRLLTEIVRDLMSSRNYEIENWVIN